MRIDQITVVYVVRFDNVLDVSVAAWLINADAEQFGFDALVASYLKDTATAHHAPHSSPLDRFPRSPARLLP